MSGFVRGGRDGEVSTRPSADEATGWAQVVEDRDRAVIVSPGREIVEVDTIEPTVVHVIEPVVVDPARLGIGLADLDDVDASNAPLNVPLVWRVDANGVWTTSPAVEGGWGEEVRFSAVQPDPSQAPVGATWVDYDTGTIYRAEEV